MNATLAESRCSEVHRPHLRSLLTSWSLRMRSRRHLAALDERMLADVGLTVADVQAEIRKPFWMA